MSYTSELNFVRTLLKKFNIPFCVFSDTQQTTPVPDLGLRKMLYSDYDYDNTLKKLIENFTDNVMYQVDDGFDCRYHAFVLPGIEPKTYALIGPYHINNIDLQRIQELLKYHGIPLTASYEVEKYYHSITYVENESQILSILSSLAEVMWEGPDSFDFEYIHGFSDEDSKILAERQNSFESKDSLLTMRILEERYETEAQIIQAISHGQAHKAEMLLLSLSVGQVEKRSPDPLRNFKNYSIIMNTLFRKAAEQGGVHPIHIDNLSSKFANKIESAGSISAVTRLQKEMIQKYCNMVKNHSLKGYSQLVRKVITKIDTDISSDLSLHKQAELLNVNPSYLSTLFKKETGHTLTEYVNRKRMDYAIYLLGATNLQIQVIAQQCGIPDVNYFTKTFKKYVGKTPKELRESSTR